MIIVQVIYRLPVHALARASAIRHRILMALARAQAHELAGDFTKKVTDFVDPTYSQTEAVRPIVEPDGGR